MITFLKIASIVLLSILFAVLGFMYFIQEKLVFLPEKLSEDHGFFFTKPFKEVKYEVEGASIHGLHFYNKEPKGIVLYLHGNAGSLDSWGNVSRIFLEQNYDIIIIDYRGYGKSTGTINREKQLLSDSEIVYNSIKTKYPENKIILYGRSLGTGLATYLASKNNPKMLILESPYSNFYEVAKHHFPFVPSFIFKYHLDAMSWIGDVKCPIYLFHGGNDRIIPIQFAEKLTKNIKSPFQFYKIENGDHNNLEMFELYVDSMEKILK